MDHNSGGMYQANDGKWYPIQGMPQGWQQGQDGKYHNPAVQGAGGGAAGSYYGGGQQGGYGGGGYGGGQYPQGQGYYGQQPMGHGQPVYVQGRPGAGGAAAGAVGGGLLAGLCCGCLFC